MPSPTSPTSPQPAPGPWCVYLLEGTTRGGRVTLHAGIALDVYARVVQHVGGQVKQTRGRAVRLLGYSSGMAHGDALRREAAIKKKPPEDKRAIAASWRATLRSMDADPIVNLAQLHLDAAQAALQKARMAFGDEHPTADDELAQAFAGLAAASRWLARL